MKKVLLGQVQTCPKYFKTEYRCKPLRFNRFPGSFHASCLKRYKNYHEITKDRNARKKAVLFSIPFLNWT
jgi:hypothetical protein